MALYVQEGFVNKYKQQYYQGDSTIQDLKDEQKKLYKLLDSLHAKVNKSFEKACDFAERKILSQRNSDNKENISKLPSLVRDAQIKNSQTYRQVLQNQKKKLEIKIKMVESIKQKDLNVQIKAEKDKLSTLIKRNRTQMLEIKKLGEKLVEEKKTPQQMYFEMYSELKIKKGQNQKKQQAIQQNQQKIKQLKQKIEEIEQKISLTPIQDEKNQSQQQKLKYQSRIKTLSSNREKIKQNIQSLKTRLNQQYYCKLKQLEGIVKKNEQLDYEIYSLKLKVCDKNQQLAQSLIIS